MLVGLIADTHDYLPMVDKAIKKLNDEDVGLVLHAGDYVAPFVIPRFKALKAKLIGVFGNNDGDRELLRKRFNENNFDIRGNFAEVSVDSVKIALLHGSDEELLKSLINSESFNIIVHGHTHKAEVYSKGKTLIVNPGEACGYLTGKSTIAVLNTERREAKIIQL
jgi:putative phosphoesterase